ncbi:ribonuclease J [Methanothermobacter tenebrarum]|uniref:Ribonuclease J n=1 Tax=Methanothermobacter tenebrarum TaxID=680118 RepID=A0ABN6PDU5_9EURY|nr:RNase J family beta-CASP ribonuclease [Methanothermobacter tenebrarum]MDD3454911.1 RNase J family beta-CASP ribonuclease [Methanobacteriales archaeon]MDI6881438.1 RNase J family beta-CASP ribonuclease [Methanothermobacter sp.]BDH79714.1 ribonuclease J [Methanothermobacter tenebrarum]
MTVEIIAIGGYEEVGKNMSAVKINDDIVIFDMGIHLDRVHVHEDTDIARMHSLDLIERGVIPDDTLMKEVNGKVRAIVFTHGHLDHIGGVAKLAHRYNAPIIGTPYTIALIEHIIKSERKFKVPNRLEVLNAGEKCQLSADMTLEFINATHSIPQSVIAALHTPEGIIVYGLDFKFDDHQIISPPPDYHRLKELGRKGVLALIVETTRVADSEEVKTPSEKVARIILEDMMKRPLEEKSAMIVTTFSSHIERIQAISDIAKKSNRQILLLGRSMERYCSLAESMGILKLPENASIFGSPKSVNRALARAEANRENYLLVTTGHQGEPDALLPRIANGKTQFNVKRGDNIIISAPVIPNPMNIANRNLMEKRLISSGARIYTNAHVSGHAGKEDHRDFLRMLNPVHVIPAHGDIYMLSAYAELAEEEGYRLGNDIHILRNGQAQVFNGGI